MKSIFFRVRDSLKAAGAFSYGRFCRGVFYGSVVANTHEHMPCFISRR